MVNGDVSELWEFLHYSKGNKPSEGKSKVARLDR